MKYIFLAIVGFMVFCIIRAAQRASDGTRYMRHCRTRFNELRNQGRSDKEALIIISKERHPELDDSVHEKIVDKCPDVHRLASFIYSTLDFCVPWQRGYGGKLTNKQAEALIEFTTVSESGRVNTDYASMKAKLGEVET